MPKKRQQSLGHWDLDGWNKQQQASISNGKEMVGSGHQLGKVCHAKRTALG